MAYTAWSVVFGEQPSAAKWNQLGANDALFYSFLGDTATGFPVQIVGNSATAVNTGTTVLPNDDTIPQITEGTEFMTQAITPESASNILVIQITAMLANSVQNTLALALFQDATANAIAAGHTEQFQGNVGSMIHLQHTMTSGTTSSTTFRVRGGGNAAGTTTFNGVAGARKYGAITKSSMIIMEYKV